jgi:hypothetical protein
MAETLVKLIPFLVDVAMQSSSQHEERLQKRLSSWKGKFVSGRKIDTH